MNTLLRCFSKCFGLDNQSRDNRSDSSSITESLPSLISQDSASPEPVVLDEPGHVHLAYISCNKECQQLRALYPNLDPDADATHLTYSTTCDPRDLIRTLRCHFGYTVSIRYFVNPPGFITCEHDRRYKRRDSWIDDLEEHCLRCQDETLADQVGVLQRAADQPLQDGIDLRQNYLAPYRWYESDNSLQSDPEDHRQGYIDELD